MERDIVSDKTICDQSIEVIAKELVIAFIQNKGVSGNSYKDIANTIGIMYDEVHKQLIKSHRENYE